MSRIKLLTALPFRYSQTYSSDLSQFVGKRLSINAFSSVLPKGIYSRILSCRQFSSTKPGMKNKDSSITPTTDTNKIDLLKANEILSFQPLRFGDQTAERSTIPKSLAMRRYLLNEEVLSRIKPFRPAWRTADGEALYLLQVVCVHYISTHPEHKKRTPIHRDTLRQDFLTPAARGAHVTGH